MTQETEWRPIDGSNMAFVSSDGQLKYLDRVSRSGRRLKARRIPSRKDRDGYLIADVDFISSHRTIKVHREVLRAFVGDPAHGQHCNHKDGVKENNNISNLEWCDAGANLAHKCRILGEGSGSNHYRSKLSDLEVAVIRDMVASRQSNVADIARHLGVSRSLVRRLVSGESYRMAGGPTGYPKDLHMDRPGRTKENSISREKKEAIIGMIVSGMTIAEVSRRSGVSEKSVGLIKKRLQPAGGEG